MLYQTFYYAYRNKRLATTGSTGNEEDQPLLSNKTDLNLTSDAIKPSIFAQLSLLGIFLGALISAILVWTGKSQFLDWLYYASSVKLFISVIKYAPQVFLIWRRRSLNGFAIGNVLAVRRIVLDCARSAKLNYGRTWVDQSYLLRNW
jgi:cystinosin